MKNKYLIHICFLLTGLLISGTIAAQKVDYKVERGVKISFSHVFDPSDVNTEIAYLTTKAPKPLSNDFSAKYKKDYNKFGKAILSRRGTENPVQDSLIVPVNKNGFIGASIAGTPNDNHMAISNDGAIVSTLNQSVLCYDEDGAKTKAWGLAFMVTNQLSDKPGGPIPTLLRTYDPKVIYDQLNDRFVMVFLNGTTDEDSRIIVGFSQTNDPTDKWNVYSITGNPLSENDIWTDYPIIATTKEDFFITINLLEEGKGWQDGFQQSVIWQIGKKEGYNADTLNTNYWYDLKYNDKALWSICPVQGAMEQSEKEIYFLTVRPGAAANDSVFMHKVDNTIASGKANYTVKQLKTNVRYGVPPTAVQPKAGFRLQTNDARVLSGVIHKDVIHYVQTTDNDQNVNSSVYHGRIENVGGEEKIYGSIITNDTLEYAYPSICYAGNGSKDQSVAITFSHVSKFHYPGTSVVYGDRYGQYSSVVKVKEGDSLINSFINDSSERWGDYTSIQRKWNKPGELWAVGSYGNEKAQSGTWIAQVIVKDNKITFEHKDGQETKAFPIPSLSKSINVEINAQEGVKYTFDFYDALGRKVFTAIRENMENGIHLVHLNNLSVRPGVYTLKVYGDASLLGSEKIIFN